MDALTMLVVFLVFVLIFLVFLILRQPDLTDGGDKENHCK
jgi:preprotein translocase subunit SecG